MVATLAEAVADCRSVLGCTARARRVQLEEYLPADAAARAVAKAGEGAEVALVFGRERTGLTNEELQLCHAAVHIPSDPEFSSLNRRPPYRCWPMKRACSCWARSRPQCRARLPRTGRQP